MSCLENIFITIFEMSLTASIVGMITIILKNILKSKIPPKILNLIWIVFLIMLINPLRIESKFSIYNIPVISSFLDEKNSEEALDKHTNKNAYFWLNNSKLKSINIKEKLRELDIENNKKFNFNETIMANKKTILNFITIIYLSGVFVDVALKILCNLKMQQKIKDKFEDKRIENLFETCKKQLEINKKILLINQKQVKTPAIYGFYNIKILLNKEILKFSDEEIKLIFLHELSHLKNGDLYLNCFLQVLQSIYWFNPCIIYLLKRLKEEIEIVNDISVIKTIKKEKINLYCKTLIKVASNSNENFLNALGVVNNVKEIEGRIKMIKNDDKFLKNSFAALAVVILTILSITVCFATTKTNEKEENINNEHDFWNENINSEQVLIEKDEEDNTMLVFPLEGEIQITATYGERIHPITKQKRVHDGLDLKAEEGQKVMTIADGIIEEAEFSASEGNQVKIKHEIQDEVFYSYYAHLSKMEVKVGDVVRTGDKIGEAGKTGMATGPHLHLKIENANGETLDPEKLLEI